MSKNQRRKSWRTAPFLLLAVVASAAILFSLLSADDRAKAQAQTSDTPTPAPTAAPADNGGSQVGVQSPQEKADAPKYGNMDSMLNELVQQVENQVLSAERAAAFAPFSAHESVAVTIHSEAGHADALWQYLENNGASPRNIGDEYIEAYVPITLLSRLSQQNGVIAISTIVPPKPVQSGFVSEGVPIHGADTWHLAGLRGEGLKIGVLDVGYDGFQALMGVELPSAAKVHAFCFNELGSPTHDLRHCEIESENHGTAVTETIYDIAPNATFYIANLTSLGDMRRAVEWMVSQDVDVINQSAGWTWTGPGDGTSPLQDSSLNTVDYAAEHGILWVNAAGNSAGSAWFGPFDDSDGDDNHNFIGSEQCNDIFLGDGESLFAQLRWADTWLQPQIDLDMYLFDRATSRVVARSSNAQPIYPFPYESISFEAESEGNYCLLVKKFGGAAPSWLQLMAFTEQTLRHHVDGYEITDPAGSANPALLAVGAARWTDTNRIEFFSSRGPTVDGRIKPDIVGVDGATVVTYGGSFFGTSQSSAYVAGMAALVMQNFPTRGAVGAAQYLKQAAIERGDSGPDNTWGHGFAMLPSQDASPPEMPLAPGCLTAIEVPANSSSGEVAISGEWDDDCISEQARASQVQGDFYSRFYTFETTADRAVTITLRSSDVEDTLLYLLEGWGTDGDIVEFNDDISERDDRHSRLVFENLEAGRYTIEATTRLPNKSGAFTLSVDMKVAKGHELPTPTDGYVDVSYGSNHACALHVTGTIHCFGDSEYGKTTPPQGKFLSVSSGEHGNCAVERDDGKLVCWGIFSLGE